MATDRQRHLIFAQAKEYSLDEEEVRAIVEEVTGQRSTALIPKELVDAVLSLIAVRGQETG